MLTGMLPFSAPNPLQVLMKHLTKAPPRMSEVNPSAQVHECLEEIVHRALQKAPNDRFESARDMLQALADTEASLPTLSPITESDELIWDPDTQALESLMDAPTGTVTFPDFDEPDTPDTPAPPEVPLPGDIDIISSFATSLEALKTADLSGYVAYIDLNCPYCYALHERISCWDLAEKIEWRLVEHASHVLDGPFDLNQEQMLSSEVFEVHHRAPDIELMLPPQRCRSTRATRLIVHTESLFPDKAHALRRSAYRVLWQEGKDIGEDEVLTALLVQHELPPEVLELCEEEPPQLTAWQAAWDDGDYDHSIPVLTHPASGRVLIGLPDERTLTEFLLATRDRVVDSTVCYYQQQPSILICGWMSHIWQLLSDVRGCCEIMQAPTGARAAELLNERAVPDLLVIEEEHLDLDTMTQLADIASARSVPWLVATRQPSPESEIRLLSMGAVEYLPVTEEATIARARLNRILRDRYNLERVVQETRTDTLTGLPTRRILIDEIESEWDRAIRTHAPISFILINLDAFKPYNKTHGYLSGDQCLEEVAKLLKSQIRRRGDLLARFGGNEFAVLLPATEREDAKGIAEQLKRSISEAGIENRAVPGGILTASIGVHMVLPDKDSSIHELVDSASRDLVARRDQPS
jgi:diguanylate cyclase (GGDEF)-like protein